jgi:hypothetical protein
MFPNLLLNHKFPFGKYDTHMEGKGIKYDETNTLHIHVSIGRDILASLILSLNKDTNVQYVFPDVDMSIWEVE